MKAKGVVVFDIDGVVANTIKENLPHALAAYAKKGGKLTQTKQLEELFRQGRPLIRSDPTNYYTILRLIEESKGQVRFDRMTQADFDVQIARFKKDAEGFRDAYLAARKEMMTKEPEKWKAMNVQYKGMAGLIQSLQQKGIEVFVSTGREQPSTIKLLEQFGIKIPANKIFAKEHGTKDKHLAEIAQVTGMPKSNIVLIDDELSQVKLAKETGAKALLARWGYASRKDWRAAAKQGIRTYGVPAKRHSRRGLRNRIIKMLK
jgi:phosphoglycolate phosphatase-like HAD superfamily hydrolase